MFWYDNHRSQLINTCQNNIIDMPDQSLEDLLNHCKICPMCRLRMAAIINCTIKNIEQKT